MADEQPTHTPQPSHPSGGGSDVEQNKVFAVLAYFWILFLVPMLAAKESKFAMYHANQGLVLFIADIIIWFGAMFFALAIPILVYPIWLAGFGLFVLHIIGIVNAAQGEMKPVPVVGNFKILKS